MRLINTYRCLDETFYERTNPVGFREPRLFLWNPDLARQLLFPEDLIQDANALAEVFSGNRILPGSEPIAIAYAGHQFGHFVPQLGDGRAHLLGEILDRSDKRWDIQLKGSGPTSFSRGGDGRCALGPAVREFVMSEAMHALGVPTTRSLAVVTTGETVYREKPVTGAVVSRVASSHLRVGTFEFFAARGNLQALHALCDYAIERHYPEIREKGADRCLALLAKVIDRQIRLVVEWMRVGFIHGVMNTDNTALSGETIDYGPCAMMSIYDPDTVFSSIDAHGRYAFGNQPQIARWNMARFAECLLPLIDTDEKKAVEIIRPMINDFSSRFEKEWTKMMGRKLGLESVVHEDSRLIDSLLDQLMKRHLDYTVTFHLLTLSLTSNQAARRIKGELQSWYDSWKKRLDEQSMTVPEVEELMKRHNPVVIPRNHHLETVIRQCEETGEASSAENFLEVLRSPYEELAQTSYYQDAPSDGDRDYQTFCGT
jgi:uncharacterized protein YdiU (UPF0061 family)